MNKIKGAFDRLARSYAGTRGRRLLMLTGGVSFLAGVVLLAYGSLSLGDSESRPAPPLVDLGNQAELERLLKERPSPSAAPTAPTSVPEPPLAGSTYRMVIERIGVNAPVNTYGLDANAVPEVPTGPEAKTVVAWYDFSAQPGTSSNAVFAGHVTWNGHAVFYDLQSLQPGDIVRLLGEDRTEVTYKISSNFSVDPNDPDSIKVMQPTETGAITLITCGGTFFRNDDPVAGGDYTLRVIVRGDLVSVTNGGQQTADTVGG